MCGRARSVGVHRDGDSLTGRELCHCCAAGIGELEHHGWVCHWGHVHAEGLAWDLTAPNVVLIEQRKRLGLHVG